MTEEKCFCWLDRTAQPGTEITVANSSLEALSVQLNQNLKQSEVKVFLLCGSKVLGQRLCCDVPSMVVINCKECFPH